jgi:predicted transcriptional regulator
MKDLSKTELLIMKCVWGTDHPVTATQIQQILLEKYVKNEMIL